jgi:hypothetical protein
MISFPVLRVRLRPRLGDRRGRVLGKRSGVLEAPALGVAVDVFDPAMIPLSNAALMPLVGDHRNLKHSRNSHSTEKNSGHRWFCVAYSLQLF